MVEKTYIIVDLEATCWEKRSSVDEMEIIEIGAVRLEESSFEAMDEFARFVRPVINPVLSDFCTSLTSIRQEQVDAAAQFPDVFPDFLAWIGDSRFRLMSWGKYDWRQFEADCGRHVVDFPPAGCDGHINLKEPFSLKYGTKKSIGLGGALRKIKLSFQGTHHRGIDDARNIARIARLLRPLIVEAD